MSIRWGIIGPGHIAQKFAEDFSEVESGVLSAVSSRSIDRAREFAQKFNIPDYYDSVEEMLVSDVVDVVYVATPHTSHQRDTLFCLKNNTHVLCEKPITVNAAQLEEITALQKEKKLFCMEAYWTLFLPAVKKAMQWIKEDRIGKISLIQANFGFKAEFDPKGRLFNPQLAGGSLLDVGMYPCMFGNLFFDEKPSGVTASALPGSTGVDEMTMFQLEYSENRILQGCSSITHNLQNTAFIYGENGRIELDDFWMARRARLITESGTDHFEDERKTTGYNFEAEAVSTMIAEGKTEHEVLTLARSLENMQTMDEIRRQIGLRYAGLG